MTPTWLERTELLIGEKGITNLQNAKVLVVGLGGVGSFAAEFLARAGVGTMVIVDGDEVDATNINRQLPALHSTIGQSKVKLVGDRLKDINPKLNLTQIEEFAEPRRMLELVRADQFDYVLDCIDSITPKLLLIKASMDMKLPLYSSMGAGGVMNPSSIKIADISKTYNCPLARTVRKRLKSKGVRKGFKAVFSTEMPDIDTMKMTDNTNFKKSFYGTISFGPAAFGLFLASEVINQIVKK